MTAQQTFKKVVNAASDAANWAEDKAFHAVDKYVRWKGEKDAEWIADYLDMSAYPLKECFKDCEGDLAEIRENFEGYDFVKGAGYFTGFCGTVGFLCTAFALSATGMGIAALAVAAGVALVKTGQWREGQQTEIIAKALAEDGYDLKDYQDPDRDTWKYKVCKTFGL